MGNKILIVDDDRVCLIILEKTLLNAGYAVAKAESGRQAIIIAKEWHPNLIIMDIMMPGMDGGETAEALERDPVTKEIPIMFLTSLLTKKEVPKWKSLLSRSFIAKPFNADDLLDKIEKFF